MCGLVAFIGKPDMNLINRMIWEAGVRGLHHLGSYEVEGAAMYHTRYCTSGETNQPLRVSNRVMIFNGVVNMGTKEEMEQQYGITMDTDNDGEVVLRKCPNIVSVADFISNPRISFAGIFIEGASLTAIRNERRPLWVRTDGTTLLAASTRDIFLRAGAGEPTILEPLKPYIWTI